MGIWSWRTLRVGAIAVAPLVVGCGPDRASDAVECDATIVPLLVLGDDEFVLRGHRLGDGAVLEIAAGDPATGVTIEGVRVVAVDECGGDSRTIAEVAVDLDAPPRPGLPWVVHFDTDAPDAGTWLLDPDHAWQRHRISNDRITELGWSERGVLTTRDSPSGSLELVEIMIAANGQLTESILADDVHRGPDFRTGTTSRKLPFISQQLEVFVVDLESLAMELVRGDAHDVQALDADARVLWVDVEVGDERSSLVGDRARGIEFNVGRADWTSRATWSADHVMWTTEGSDEEIEETQLILLPEMRELWLPGDWSFFGAGRDPNGTRVFGPRAGFHRLRPAEDVPEWFAPGEGMALCFGEAFYLYDFGPRDAQPTEPPYPLRLRRMETADAAPVDVLGREVFDLYPLSGERWAYIAEADANGTGVLRLWDRATNEHSTVASDVKSPLEAVNGDEFWMSLDQVRDDLLFVGTGPDGQGRAVWLARADALF